MELILIAILVEAAILASSLSIDAFTAGFAYGTNKIKIPFISVLIINFICSSITGLALLVGTVLKPYFSEWIAVLIAFTMLFLIGVAKLLDSITKSIIRKHTNFNKEIKISMFNFKFILNLYANPEAVDIDASKTISPREAAALAISLSLDGIAVGFGAALSNVNGIAVFVWSLVTNALAIILGCYVGNKVVQKISFNISWLSGVILIILAFFKILT